MNLFTAVVLGLMLWNWPVSTFLSDRAMFNGVTIGLYVSLVIIWIYNVIQIFRK